MPRLQRVDRCHSHLSRKGSHSHRRRHLLGSLIAFNQIDMLGGVHPEQVFLGGMLWLTGGQLGVQWGDLDRFMEASFGIRVGHVVADGL